MTEPAITTEQVAQHNLTSEESARACKPLLGSDDGRWIFESSFAALEKDTAAQAA